jgi:propionate CoA-transferase
VQVERITAEPMHNPKEVRIPGILVDAVVVATPDRHMQTFGEAYNPAYTGEIRIPTATTTTTPLDARKVIARRAAMFLKPNAVVNLGIGMPEGIASVASEERILDLITPTVEAGGIGGIPAGGLSFGAVANAQSIIDQPYQFDFYDGGGLDQAFLGMAEVDRQGNVNVSRFRPKLAGPGGFINISQNAKAVYFMATFTPRTQTTVDGGRLRLLHDEPAKRFVGAVQQVTFSGPYALERGQSVHYVTERCVFRLTDAGLELVELAPGIDLQRDVLAHMQFTPTVPDEIGLMDQRIFLDEPMGLAHRWPMSMHDRLRYDPEHNVLDVNLEGLTVDTVQDANELAAFLDRRLADLGHRVNVVVNYDDFDLGRSAEETFFAMVRHNAERHFLSSARYATNAFIRYQLGERFTQASLEQRIYPDSAEARGAVRGSA